MISILVRFIGRSIFWRINKKDRVYLENYYNSIANIDGEVDFARKQTEIMKEEILLKKEINFYQRLSK